MIKKLICVIMICISVVTLSGCSLFHQLASAAIAYGVYEATKD